MQLLIIGNDKKIAALERELRFRAKISGFSMELIDDSEPFDEPELEAEETGNDDEQEEEEIEANKTPVQPKSMPVKHKNQVKKAGRPKIKK